jgi:hypothetical protein
MKVFAVVCIALMVASTFAAQSKMTNAQLAKLHSLK